jgi:hypothetical protein
MGSPIGFIERGLEIQSHGEATQLALELLSHLEDEPLILDDARSSDEGHVLGHFACHFMLHWVMSHWVLSWCFFLAASIKDAKSGWGFNG